jgi:TfoX/Sxy family transcriptional regulator of competence genes
MSYFEAPPEVLDDARVLIEWARRSVAVAQRAPPARQKRRTSEKTRRAARRRAGVARAKR